MVPCVKVVRRSGPSPLADEGLATPHTPHDGLVTMVTQVAASLAPTTTTTQHLTLSQVQLGT